MKKQFFSILSVLLILICLTGCSSVKKQTLSEAKTQAYLKEQDVKISYIDATRFGISQKDCPKLIFATNDYEDIKLYYFEFKSKKLAKQFVKEADNFYDNHMPTNTYSKANYDYKLYEKGVTYGFIYRYKNKIIYCSTDDKENLTEINNIATDLCINLNGKK